jgi:hypothetical protein
MNAIFHLAKALLCIAHVYCKERIPPCIHNMNAMNFKYCKVFIMMKMSLICVQRPIEVIALIWFVLLCIKLTAFLFCRV